jgi:hypothetical protein
MRGTTRTGSPPQADVYTTETDDRGRFVIHGVAPGNYRVQLQRNGFAYWRPGVVMPPLTVAPGQQAVVAFEMMPTGVIAGRVVDPEGEPIRNASIEALQYSYTASGRQLSPMRQASTNDRGEYRLFDLPPGSYYLRATVRQPFASSSMPGDQIRGGKAPEGFVDTYFPSVRDASQAAPLEVAAAAEVRDVVIRLWPERVYSVRLRIPVQPGDGPRIPPMINVERRDAPSSRGMGAGSRMSMSDSSNWIFEFPSLIPGPYLLTAVQTDPANRDKRTYARELFDLADRDVEIGALNFVPGMNIAGKVKVDGEAPFGLQELWISLESRSFRFRGMTASPANADGTFTLRDVAPDIGTLQVRIPAGAYLKSAKFGEKQLDGMEIDFSGAGDNAGPVTILLGTDGGRIEGTVATAQEAPAAQKGVMLFREGGGRAEMPRIQTTDDQGSFVFRDIPPGKYRLFAWEEGFTGAPLDPEFRRKFENQSVAVAVEANSRKTVSLKAIVTAAK